MRLHWITRKEHDKLMLHKDDITMGWINKCNKLNKENEYLRVKVKDLESMVKWHESNECKLNKELCRTKGQLNKLDNYIRLTTGTSILEGEK